MLYPLLHPHATGSERPPKRKKNLFFFNAFWGRQSSPCSVLRVPVSALSGGFIGLNGMLTLGLCSLECSPEGHTQWDAHLRFVLIRMLSFGM